MAAVAAPGAVDARYEFDAPQHWDFEAEDTASQGSGWFAAQEEAGTEEQAQSAQAGPSGRTPLKSVNTDAVAAAGAGTLEGKHAKKKNIVTSWGPDAQKKRKAKEGVTNQPTAKAPKQGRDAAATQPAAQPKTRAQHAAATEREGRGKASKELKAIKLPLKAKSKSKPVQLLLAKAKAAAGIRNAKAGGAAAPKAGGSGVAGAAAGGPAGLAAAGPVTGGAKAARRPLSKLLQPRRVMPTRSTKQLTVPQDVELATTKRAHTHVATTSRPSAAAAGGRGGAAGGAKQHTHPPLQRGGKHKRAGGDDDGDEEASEEEDVEAGGVSPYKPLVLRVKEFDKTPGRFKRQPDRLPQPSKPLTVTEPQEPHLVTTTRARPSVFKPREVAELEEMAAMPVFRASTVNPLVLHSSGLIGVPKVDKRELTAPQPFHFITDDRAEVRAVREAELQQEHLDKAGEAGPSSWHQHQPHQPYQQDKHGERELPKRARKSVAFQPEEPVVPRSPMLLTKMRAREAPKVEEPRQEFHARPVPKFLSVPSVDLPAGHHGEAAAPTVPEPFHLATDKRGEAYRSQLAARQAAEEQVARSVRVPRALGLPLSTDMPMVPPRPEPRALTVPEPFGLASEARHEGYEEKKHRALEAEEETRRADAEFKARPMWRGIPFRVHESVAGLTVPEEVPLATSARAGEREAFNRTLEEKWKEAEVAQQLATQEARMREEEERRQLRKAANFHARPMPDLTAQPAAKPPPAKPPLTKPVSPRLGKSKRRAADSAGSDK